jgi:hypothetical protein
MVAPIRWRVECRQPENYKFTLHNTDIVIILDIPSTALEIIESNLSTWFPFPTIKLRHPSVLSIKTIIDI